MTQESPRFFGRIGFNELVLAKQFQIFRQDGYGNDTFDYFISVMFHNRISCVHRLNLFQENSPSQYYFQLRAAAILRRALEIIPSVHHLGIQGFGEALWLIDDDMYRRIDMLTVIRNHVMPVAKAIIRRLQQGRDYAQENIDEIYRTMLF